MKNIKTFLVIIIVVIIIGIGCYNILESKKEISPFIIDAKNCTYIIGTNEITLEEGYSETEVVPDSASKVITRYFGNEIEGDFDNDGLLDKSFILTQETGGSGTFYYLAVALKKGDICKGINTIFLGDRIIPQSIDFKDGEIIVNYLDRRLEEPMSNIPSIETIRYFEVNNDELFEKQKADNLIYAYYSNDSEELEAVFDNNNHTVTFTQKDLGTITLSIAMSASGSRYINEDESIVFWEHQGELTITKDDNIVFQGNVKDNI